MHPHTRFTLALLASLGLWWPTLTAALAGDVDVLAAALRWVLAFLVASLAFHVIGSLLHAYAPEEEVALDPELLAELDDAPDLAPAAAPAKRGRRSPVTGSRAA